jgi:hypothetical protein
MPFNGRQRASGTPCFGFCHVVTCRAGFNAFPVSAAAGMGRSLIIFTEPLVTQFSQFTACRFSRTANSSPTPSGSWDRSGSREPSKPAQPVADEDVFLYRTRPVVTISRHRRPPVSYLP